VKTRDSHLAMMEAASVKQIKFVGGTKGGFIFNDFLFASDGMYSVAKLLECLALTKKRLGELDKETSRLHLIKKDIPCSWNLKGQVMRHVMKDSERVPRELIDGVKLFPRDKDPLTSVLLNPDRTRPLFHINAESRDPSLAQRLAVEYETKLNRWINNA
jgi:mannose-1-phosphate guanylyltransferase/phosphomannomutase